MVFSVFTSRAARIAKSTFVLTKLIRRRSCFTEIPGCSPYRIWIPFLIPNRTGNTLASSKAAKSSPVNTKGPSRYTRTAQYDARGAVPSMLATRRHNSLRLVMTHLIFGKVKDMSLYVYIHLILMRSEAHTLQALCSLFSHLIKKED